MLFARTRAGENHGPGEIESQRYWHITISRICTRLWFRISAFGDPVNALLTMLPPFLVKYRLHFAQYPRKRGLSASAEIAPARCHFRNMKSARLRIREISSNEDAMISAMARISSQAQAVTQPPQFRHIALLA